MAKQEITSAATSLNQVPALHKTYAGRVLDGLAFIPDAVIDFGAGKYDKAGEYISEALFGLDYFPHDPYNRTPEENERALFEAASRMTHGLCANVLNVIAEPEARAELIALVAANVDTAFFSVYDGDRSGIGKRTRCGWQNNAKAELYLPELRAAFAHVELKNGVFTCWND